MKPQSTGATVTATEDRQREGRQEKWRDETHSKQDIQEYRASPLPVCVSLSLSFSVSFSLTICLTLSFLLLQRVGAITWLCLACLSSGVESSGEMKVLSRIITWRHPG